MPPRSREEVHAKFKEYDTNNSDAFSEDELLDCLRDLGILGSAESADSEYETLLRDHFMERADANKDGTLSFEEFFAALIDWDSRADDPAAGLTELPSVVSSTTTAAGANITVATNAASAPRFVFGRFEPVMAVSISNFLASIWEDVFDKSQEALIGASDHSEVWIDVAAAAGHFIIVLIMCTALRLLISHVISAPRTRALCIMSVQASKELLPHLLRDIP